MNNYYVYIYEDLSKKRNRVININKYEIISENEIIYVGKGKNNRVNSHIQPFKLQTDSNKIKVNKFLKLIESKSLSKRIIIDNLTENEALSIEEELISLLGRICSKDGFLTNINSKYDYSIKNKKVSSTKKAQNKKLTQEQKDLLLAYAKQPKSQEFKDKTSKRIKEEFLSGKRDILLKNFVEKSRQPDIRKIVSEKIKEFYSKNLHHASKEIEQYDLNNNLIKTYLSIEKASKEINRDTSTLSRASRGLSKSKNPHFCAGFIWKLKGSGSSTTL